MRNVGILLFNDIELLDFGGSYSVFHMAKKISKETEFNIFTIAEGIKDITD
ncbi:hypothetical protein [Clostridium sp.]|uniref:hypothetical protein n=1 Tax=Clostridium sp. TaxID=1506 RepID=UPI003464C568